MPAWITLSVASEAGTPHSALVIFHTAEVTDSSFVSPTTRTPLSWGFFACLGGFQAVVASPAHLARYELVLTRSDVGLGQPLGQRTFSLSCRPMIGNSGNTQPRPMSVTSRSSVYVFIVNAISLCRITACAVRGDTPAADRCVPVECRIACKCTRPSFSSILSIPAATRSRLRIRNKPSGTTKTKSCGGLSRRTMPADRRQVASKWDRDATSVFSLETLSTKNGTSPNDKSPTRNVRSSFDRNPVKINVL